MSCKQDLKLFLSAISTNVQFIKFNYRSRNNFSIVLKCSVDDNQSPEFYNQKTNEWLDKFSKFTKTDWTVRYSFPHVGKYIYRKICVCRWIDVDINNLNENKTKMRQCIAKIEFIVKMATCVALKYDRYLKSGLNLSIFIEFIHSHDVKDAIDFRVWEELAKRDQLFFRYFQMGCTAAVAKIFHQLILASKFGNKSNEYQSPEINPNLEYIDTLFKKWRNRKSAKCLVKITSDMQSNLTEAGGHLAFVENCTTAIVITPIMKRTIERHSLDSVHVDRTCMRYGHIVNTIYVRNSVCLLPIVFIVQHKLDEHAFGLSIDAIKVYIQNECKNQFEPTILTVNASEDHFQNMMAVFFNCKMLKSYTTMCREVWHWLCCDESKLSYRKRNDIMSALQVLLSAPNAEAAHSIYLELLKNDVFHTLSSMKTLIDDLWHRKEQWLDSGVGQQHHNFIDICLRMSAQLFISRCKSFNVFLMVEFVTTIIDHQYRKILSALTIYSNVLPIYTKYLPRSNNVIQMGAKITQFGDEYRYAVSATKSIHFNSNTWRCNCVYGRKNEFCEHLTAILIMSPKAGLINVTDRERKLFIEILGETTEELYISDVEIDDGVYAPDLITNVKCENIDEVESIDEREDDDPYGTSAGLVPIEDDGARNSPTLNLSDVDIHREPDENTSIPSQRLIDGQSKEDGEIITVIKKEIIDYSYNDNTASGKQNEDRTIQNYEGINYPVHVDDELRRKTQENSHKHANIPVIVADKDDVGINRHNSALLDRDKQAATPVRVSVIAQHGKAKRATCRNPSRDATDERDREKRTKRAKSNANVSEKYDERRSPSPETVPGHYYIIRESDHESAKKMRYSDRSEDDPSALTHNSNYQYDRALKSLNCQFRRLYGFFKKVPSKANMATMERLTRELAKIQPVRRVDLSNMYLNP